MYLEVATELNKDFVIDATDDYGGPARFIRRSDIGEEPNVTFVRRSRKALHLDSIRYQKHSCQCRTTSLMCV